MVIKAKKGFYEKLSRKELQSMCKLYGLPANKSHSQLEKSLFAFLEKASPKCNESSANHRKAQRKNSAEKCLSFSKDDTVVELGPETTDHRDVGDGRCPTKDALKVATPTEKSAKRCSPPFQFYVRSEDGLNLCVDLNSSPSDWSQKFKSEVQIIDNVLYNKSRSLHDDLECLKGVEKEMNPDGNINSGRIRDVHVDSHCSPCSEEEKIDQLELDQPEKGGEMMLDPHSIQTSSVCMDVSEKSKENNQLPCYPNCDSPDRIVSAADSCGKAPCAAVLDSNVLDYDTVGCPPSEAILDQATTDLSRSSLPNPATVYLGCSVSSSIEMQSSEVTSCNKDDSGLHCENGGLVGEFDTKDNKESEKSGLANSSEFNHMPVSVEEGERINILNERESSESSELIKASEIKVGTPKRKHVESSSYAQPNVKILRSMKRKKDLPRRSMRLLSKVIALISSIVKGFRFP